MKPAIIPGLLKCNTEATEGKGGFQRREWAFGMPGLHDHSAIGMPWGVNFPEALLAQTAAP